MRVFRYSSDKKPLAANRNHNFALQYTLAIYSSDAAYSFIPKNGCSTLRYSIAKANGCIEKMEEVDWIHSNNQTFSMTTGEAFKAKYTFVILRCPFMRLVSCFLDKMVDMDMVAWRYRNVRSRNFHPHDLTFDYFLRDIGKAPRTAFDIHWKPQVDFLLYRDYDGIFCLEQFEAALKTLKEAIDLDLYDTRPYLNHHIDSAKIDPSMSSPYSLPAIDLLVQRRSGRIPEAAAMYNEELAHIVKKVYREDIEMYLDHFPPSPLMEKLL